MKNVGCCERKRAVKMAATNDDVDADATRRKRTRDEEATSGVPPEDQDHRTPKRRAHAKKKSARARKTTRVAHLRGACEARRALEERFLSDKGARRLEGEERQAEVAAREDAACGQ